MKIVGIHEPYLYSVQFDDNGIDEYHRLFEQWSNAEAVYNFLEENRTVYDSYWTEHFDSTREAAESIVDESEDIEQHLEELADNADEGLKPDFETFFQPLNGVYTYDIKYQAMKGYGTYTPSMLRLYAVKVNPNLYVIADGGIKLGRKIQDSPDLKDHVLNKIDITKKYLSFNCVTTSDDMSE